MAARKVHVYRLAITYPEGSQEPGWQPANWHEICLERYWNEEHFRWPKERLYLSPEAASERARFLRGLGAHAVVVRSNEVSWPLDPDLAAELWTAAFAIRGAKTPEAVDAISDSLVALAKRVVA